MTSLRLLKFYMPEHLDVSDKRLNVHLSGDLKYLSDELRYFYWHGYPYNTLPKDFNPENLIRLCLPYSKVERLWKEKKEAYKLKYIDLRHSQYLTTIPDPLETPNLEQLNLLNCVKLPCVPSYIQNFNNLGSLSLMGCKYLTCFPHNIHFRAPIAINLWDCVKLTEFPEISGKVVVLNLRGTAIEEVPSSVESLTDLEILDMSFCTRLKILPTSICKLKSLSSLGLDGCSKLESFPEILEKIEGLRNIGLKSTMIKELPSSIENVEGLEFLHLAGCSEIHSLPENLRNLKSLVGIFGEKTAITQIPYSIRDLNKIGKLKFSGCRGFVLPPLSIFSSLTDLTIDYCDVKEIPHDIGCLSSLAVLNIAGNNFESLPTSIKQLFRLFQLILNNCNMLQSLPELPISLGYLEARNCKRLQSLPELPSRQDELDASIVDKLFKQHVNGFKDINMFEFTSCMKLNENTNNNFSADSQLRIQHMATTSLRKFNEWVFIDFPPGANICFPGSRIPEWFSNQSLGSSITIQLPQLCCNRSFIGFALCVVLAFEDVVQAGSYFKVQCTYGFEAKKYWLQNTYWDMRFEDDIIYDSDHVCLGFDPCLRDLDHHTSLSFDFSPVYGKRAKVKGCGVCPVYLRPIERKPNTFTVNMVPPTEEECRTLHNEFRDEASTSATNTERSKEEETNGPQQQSSFFSQIFRCLGLDFSCL
ncbi:Disease resistance protein [Melia azedarach]|uniref:Disease resistance protein n=1 Tax=Melia azedarach TaxID=155640 RepID=A0ACC1YHY3_MELAZ|nr:Disease resistance protein [Melia azedarach]